MNDSFFSVSEIGIGNNYIVVGAWQIQSLNILGLNTCRYFISAKCIQTAFINVFFFFYLP